MTNQELSIYNEFHKRADQFLDRTVCAEELRDYRDYIPGSQKISYYHQKLSQTEDVQIEDFDGREYERSIINRLSDNSDRNNLLVTIGAVGAGKTTCISEITRILNSKLSAAMIPGKVKPFKPLVIPCLHMISSDSELQLLKTILTSVLDRIMSVWLQNYQIPDQHTRNLLQSLSLIELVGNWAFTQNRHTFPRADIANPLLDLPLQELFQYEPNSEYFQNHLSELRPITHKIQEYYYKLIEDVERARNAVSCALGLLEELTENRKIPKVVIVDNLDQLPTAIVQKIIESLYSISAVNSKVKFLVPLRPSSLGINRYTQNITYVYHNGPCTFYFIYHRLKRYILSRSINELSHQELYIESPRCKTPQEISALISTAYIYACLMLVGSDDTMSLNKAISKVRKSVHSDHKHIITAIHMPFGTARAVVDMIGAIVGLSGRYAVAQVSQFFADLYHSPEILYNIFREQESKQKIRITYKRLITTLFFSQSRKISLGRYLNLFTPVESTSNPRRPSLVKILILSHIEENGAITFSALTKKLAAYGVPTDIAIRSLIKLHDERRRLVWFSSNQAVQGKSYNSDECTVISEQGMRYLYGLVQTFDYLWVCSAQIRGETEEDPIFPVKLTRYIFLIRELLEIELKQSAFFICGDHESVPPTGTPNNHITLRLLLRSIPQAVKSSRIAFSITDRGTQYSKNLAEYLVIVVQLLQQAIIEYRYCFGGPYYVIHYREELDLAIEILQELLNKMGHTLEEQNYTKISNGVLFLTKQINEYKVFDEQLRDRPISPDLDPVTEVSKYGRVILPDKKMKQIDTLELDKTEKELLKEKQGELAHILTLYIPRFQELSAKLLSITDQLAICVKTSEQVGVSTGRETYEWLRKEQAWWQEVVRQLETSRYAVETQDLSRSTADIAKSRFNSRIKLLEKLCAELNVSPPLRLSRALWA